MLRRRYYKKKEAAGKAEGREKAYAPVWHGAGSKRSVSCCAENGFVGLWTGGDASTTVCFTGHRNLSSTEIHSLRRQLRAEILELAGKGIRTFLSGGALGFDTIAAQEVLSCKEQLPEIRLKMVLPCRGQASYWSVEDQAVYHDILQRADEVLCLSDHYYKGCMLFRNRYLVVHSSVCVCYFKDQHGGTSYTVAFAGRQGLRIRNLAVSVPFSIEE